MPQSFENELNKPVHDEDLYSEMYETLYGLQDDFDLYRERINEALMLITIMEQRQAQFMRNFGRTVPRQTPPRRAPEDYRPAESRRMAEERRAAAEEDYVPPSARRHSEEYIRPTARAEYYPAPTARPDTEQGMAEPPRRQSPERRQSPARRYSDELWSSPNVRAVQQQMQLSPESAKYPAYQREKPREPEESYWDMSPSTVQQSSKSVPVPEKFLDDDFDIDDERGQHGGASRSGKKSKRSERGKKQKAEQESSREHNESARAAKKDAKAGQSKPRSGKQQRISRAKDAVFYLVLVIMVSMVLVLSMSRGDGVRSLAGFSAFVVKSSSMEDVYPKNSVILTRSVEPAQLKIGDDITFFTNSTTTVTHRIIGIQEQYAQTGQRGFETKGTMNENADKEIVPAVNVIGRVVFCSALLGSIILFITKQWPLLLFFVVVITTLIIVLRKILKS